jgi:hypothetical protein
VRGVYRARFLRYKQIEMEWRNFEPAPTNCVEHFSQTTARVSFIMLKWIALFTNAFFSRTKPLAL